MFRFPPPPSKPFEAEHRRLDREVLLYLEWYIGKNGAPPSIRMICKALGGKSTSTIDRSLTRLVSMGYITRNDGTIRLTAKLWKE